LLNRNGLQTKRKKSEKRRDAVIGLPHIGSMQTAILKQLQRSATWYSITNERLNEIVQGLLDAGLVVVTGHSRTEVLLRLK
jgi:hypothetical protein